MYSLQGVAFRGIGSIPEALIGLQFNASLNFLKKNQYICAFKIQDLLRT